MRSTIVDCLVCTAWSGRGLQASGVTAHVPLRSGRLGIETQHIPYRAHTAQPRYAPALAPFYVIARALSCRDARVNTVPAARPATPGLRRRARPTCISIAFGCGLLVPVRIVAFLMIPHSADRRRERNPRDWGGFTYRLVEHPSLSLVSGHESLWCVFSARLVRLVELGASSLHTGECVGLGPRLRIGASGVGGPHLVNQRTADVRERTSQNSSIPGTFLSVYARAGLGARGTQSSAAPPQLPARAATRAGRSSGAASWSLWQTQ